MGNVIATVHTVPYHAQWASAHLVEDIVTGKIPASEDPHWADYGAISPQEYEWWSWRLCGMACLRMALEHFGHSAPSAMELASECTAAGGYVKHDGGLRGLIYAPFASWIEDRFGLVAEVRPELAASEIPSVIARGQLVMLSVHPSIRHPLDNPPEPGGHLVLGVGATAEDLVIHNPSGYPDASQQYAQVPWGRLHHFFAGRGVILGAEPSSTR
ncbi:C39 family peptidase [Streptomyces aureocirculatus]|uniref:C39 family peptidase n=1 Tax=Streptomyces aureocirculatus TaxID=67275 RepID=UPI0004CA427E|nr:C39 family peptidase [Streptomyces aureocirculatus]